MASASALASAAASEARDRCESLDECDTLDLVLCETSDIFVLLDNENCQKCPDEEWPDNSRTNCVPKLYDFLSYEHDTLVIIFIVVILLFSLLTLFILGKFLSCWDTPIVKANNRTVSFILLISILLSFLCVFLFLGRPENITCMLRQTSFAIFFSITVSCVLSKTITVFIAFKTTKPNSFWKKWMDIKKANYVVFICSSFQALICCFWLSGSPPHQEFDYHTYHEKIIVLCNEGSDIWFYSVLGYMGFLAVVSFVLAFMVRTLPDTFNEAKSITFSMLVFCSLNGQERRVTDIVYEFKLHFSQMSKHGISSISTMEYYPGDP
ncbi:vomeronasal type-2 receptor 26-like [Bufo gargarizans]|uniref:vomeronasal type-2 receptor 26-like n=1 Tax=Bufo gargarizans TaxID=30331 RepID=UPI001CF12D65|nr:vomeronasal type-2 receptor 26-like [Bufo gargarizans]